MLALNKGGLVTEVNLTYLLREQEYRFNLKGESLGLTSLKTPAPAPIETADELEGAVIEKVALCEVVTDLIDGLFQRFIKLRVSDQWERKVVPKVREWIKGTGN
jgi:hypothetical protein